MEGNGNLPRGTGAKFLISSASPGRSASAGAASNAPLIFVSSSGGAPFAQWARAMHPRLCAAKTMGSWALATSVEIPSIQSASRGVFHSFCCTRRNAGSACSHMVCQCWGPEFCQPGSTSTLAAGPGRGKAIGIFKCLPQSRRAEIFTNVGQALLQRAQSTLKINRVGQSNVAPHGIWTGGGARGLKKSPAAKVVQFRISAELIQQYARHCG